VISEDTLKVTLAALIHDLGKFWQRAGQEHMPKPVSLLWMSFNASSLADRLGVSGAAKGANVQ